MRKVNFILYFIFSLLFSCLNLDDLPEQYVPTIDEEEEEEEELNFIPIDSFKWTKVIDVDYLRANRSLSTRFTQLHGNKIIFNLFEQGGFVAFDKSNGDLQWDNRGSFSELSFLYPSVLDGELFYINRSGVRAIDLNSGGILHNESYFINNQYLNKDFGIYEDKIYIHVDDYKYIEPIFNEWIVADIKSINQNNWTHFNRITPDMNDGYKRTYHFPNFYEDKNGNSQIVYVGQESNDLFITGWLSLFSYNLDADSLEWSVINFSPVGGLTQAPIIDEGRIYTLGQERAFCFSAETGDVIWEIGAPIMLDKLTGYADFFIHEDKLVITGKHDQTICLDKHTGATIWSNKFPDSNPDSRYRGGANRFTANVYNDKLYYINGNGSLVSMNMSDGRNFKTYAFRQWVFLDEYDVELFEPTFSKNHMIISDDGVIYTSDGYRFLAFDVPN
jgi:outer membrane protein assembly factor BamB